VSLADTLQRVFPDSNILIEGLFAPWSASRAILILARARVFRLVLSPYVQEEVERALLNRLASNEAEGARVIDDYALALTLLAPELTARITQATPRTSLRRSLHGPGCESLLPTNSSLSTAYGRLEFVHLKEPDRAELASFRPGPRTGSRTPGAAARLPARIAASCPGS
jgi:hypothetical protein